jgi:hypothetical protein
LFLSKFILEIEICVCWNHESLSFPGKKNLIQRLKEVVNHFLQHIYTSIIGLILASPVLAVHPFLLLCYHHASGC